MAPADEGRWIIKIPKGGWVAAIYSGYIPPRGAADTEVCTTYRFNSETMTTTTMDGAKGCISKDRKRTAFKLI